MKLLLTGASGFIGKNFLEFAPKDIEIIGLYNKSTDIGRFVGENSLKNVELHKCDLTHKRETEKLFDKIGKNFEYCLFLAGNVNVPLSKSNPDKDLDMTAGSLINILQSCNKITRLVYLSTAGVYDGLKGEVTPDAKLNPTVPYCISKLMAEQYVKFYSSIGKISQYAILRFGGAFGKYSEKKFMTKLVDDVCIQNKKTIEIYGDGTNIINVMYTKDTVKALIACIESTKSNITCNLGQENITITGMVEKIAQIFNKEVHIQYIPKLKAQKYITFKTKVDFNDIFNFKPDYSFEESIKEFSKELKNGN